MIVKIKREGELIKFGRKLLSEEECLDKICDYVNGLKKNLTLISFMDKVSASGRYYRNLRFNFIDGIHFKNVNYLFDRELVTDREFWGKLCERLFKVFESKALYCFQGNILIEMLANFILKCFDTNSIDTTDKIFEVYSLQEIKDYIITRSNSLLLRLNNERLTGSKIPVSVYYLIGTLSIFGGFIPSVPQSWVQVLAVFYTPLMFFMAGQTQLEDDYDKKDNTSDEDLEQLQKLQEDIDNKITIIEAEQRKEHFLDLIKSDKTYLEQNNDPKKLCVVELLDDLEDKYRKDDSNLSVSERLNYLKELVKLEVVLYYGSDISPQSAKVRPIDQNFIRARLYYLGVENIFKNRYLAMALEDIYYVIDHPYEGYEYEVMRLFSEVVSLLKELNVSDELPHSTYVAFLVKIGEIKNLFGALKLKGANKAEAKQPVRSLEQLSIETKNALSTQDVAGKAMSIEPVKG